MSSMFDSAVYNRRKQTPWARVNVIQFMKDMCYNDEEHRSMSLSVHYRPDVASRFWWVINWTGADGERHEQSAQELDLCLWRAAEAELRIEERLGLESKTQLTMRAPDSPSAVGTDSESTESASGLRSPLGALSNFNVEQISLSRFVCVYKDSGGR